MIDAIDADMHARAGDAKLTPWLLVLDCAPLHAAKEFRSTMRDSRPHIKLCYVQRNFTENTQPLDRAYMRAFKNSIRPRGSQNTSPRFFFFGSRVQLRTCQSGLQYIAVLRQLLLSSVHTAAQNADSPQHRTAAWRFIDWNEVEQRELFAEAKRLLETGELFPRGTGEELHAPDAEAEPSDSESEAHVVEPLADDHCSDDGEDAPTGVEESAAPAAPAVAAAPQRAAMSLLERLQAIRIIYGSTATNVTASLPLCRSHRKKAVVHNPGPGARVSAHRHQRLCSCSCQSRRCRHLLVQKELSFIVASLSIRSSRCFHVSSRSSPVPSLALRIGSNDQCDGNQCCPSFGGCLRCTQEWRLNVPQHGETHQVLTCSKN